MPRAIKAFGCEFACGRISTHRKRMLDHEARCFRNPVRRACQSCCHFVAAVEGDETDGYATDPAHCAVRNNVDFIKTLECDCEKWAPESQLDNQPPPRVESGR